MKTLTITLFFLAVCTLFSCQQAEKKEARATVPASYFDVPADGIKTGGVRMVPVKTSRGDFKVWTKQIGNNPTIRVLLLNGGPGCSHEYFECFESFFPKEGIEIIYYDQLGTGNSDNPGDTSLWDLPRYVEELEIVRRALNLNKDNFYLLGHSWGGILAMEYALKYQQHLKGLVISNMMSSAPAYGKYADEVLALQMDTAVLQEIRKLEAGKDFLNPRYMELLLPNYYEQHILRLPQSQWPDPVNRSFNKLNNSLYTTMQGPSEFGISGKLRQWDVSGRLKEITVPTLVIGSKHDTMDPAHMEWMSKQFPAGSYLYCPNGSHMSMYDDQETYMKGLLGFLGQKR